MNQRVPSIDEIAGYYRIPVGDIDTVTIVNGSIRIPVYAVHPGDRWGRTVDLDYSRLFITTTRDTLPERSELRRSKSDAASFDLLEEIQKLREEAQPVLGDDYASRRWVAVHITHGIFAFLPPGLPWNVKQAAVEFLKRDLFYYDYAKPFSFEMLGTDGAALNPVSFRENRAALEISVISGIEKPLEHFLGIAETLHDQSGAHIYEYVLDGNPSEIARLERLFKDEYGSAPFSGRYHLEAVSRKELMARGRQAIKKVFNEVQKTSGFNSLRDFQQRITFSSSDESLLQEAVTVAGWLILNDVDRHPGVQAALTERSIDLSAGLLRAELLKKLESIRAYRQFVPGSEALGDFNLLALASLWDSYAASRLLDHSA